MSIPLTLEDMEARIKGMSPVQKEALRKTVAKQAQRPWLPQPGPQTEAYHSKADELLYGGAVGGGKSDLLLGLATTAHTRSIIFRRQAVDLDKLWSRLVDQIMAGRIVKSDANKHKCRTIDERFIEFGHLEKPGAEKSHQGNDHDFYGFDEGAQLDEFKVAFVIQWLRSTKEGQRKRVVIATNPPIPEIIDGKVVNTGQGAWLKDWFAPWLEETYPDQAEPGELRWCFMRTDGDRMTTVWVEGPGAYDPQTGAAVESWTQDDIDKGLVAIAKSRTFIKSLLKDNAYLKNTGYAAQLSSTPEPLRSLLLSGSFTVKGEDHPFQVIPTNWVLLAQERWRQRQREGDISRAGVVHPKFKQLVLSADVAQGGMDTFVIAPLYETDIYGELKTQPGRMTPTGTESSLFLIANHKDGALIVLDGTGGWAGATRQALSDNHKIEAELCIASEKSTGWTEDMRYKYLNVRSEMWWEMRIALDPQGPFEIALPPSTRLMTQLTAPIFMIVGKTLQIESKDELRKRLGSSTDEADAVIQARKYREQAIAARFNARPDIVQRLVHGTTQEQFEAQQNAPQDLDDPLKGWR